jgi:predicted HicB family RNase H-like nuclease
VNDVARHYTYRVRWSPDDDMFVGTVAELASLSWLADSQTEALDGVVRLAREVVADLAASGEPVPAALADKHYSGRFIVRLPPEDHRRLALDAAEQNVSLNRLVASRLARA